MTGRARRILLASEVRRRWPVHAGLTGVFAFATAALVVTLGAVHGVVDAVGAEVEDTLSAQWRVGDGVTQAGDGRAFNGSHALADRLEMAVAADHGVPRSAVHATPRLETEALFSRDREVRQLVAEDVEAGLLVGVDPARDPGTLRVTDRLAEGRFLASSTTTWINGTPYPEVVLGVDLLENLGLDVYGGGDLTEDHVIQLTAGRTRGGDGSREPVTLTGVVVGTVETGYQFLDRRVAYVHLATSREALGLQLHDDAANVILLTVPEGAGVPAAAHAEGFEAVSARAFMEEHVGGLLDPVDAFIRVVGVVVLALAGGWVAHVASAAVMADRQRIAVLRALGFPSSLVLGPVALLVVVTGALGAVLGMGAAWLLARGLDVVRVYPPGFGEFRLLVTLSPGTVAAIAAAVLATAAIAAAVTGLALRRIPVTDALKGRA